MFDLLRSIARSRKAKASAAPLAKLVAAGSALAVFREPDEIERISRDDFVRAYIYGAIAFSIRGCFPELQEDVETRGGIMNATFEILFPGRGRTMVVANEEKAVVLDKEFRRVAALGMEEMKLLLEGIESNTPRTLESLRVRLMRISAAEGE